MNTHPGPIATHMLHVPEGVDLVGDYIALLGCDYHRRLDREARARERLQSIDEEIDRRRDKEIDRETVKLLRQSLPPPSERPGPSRQITRTKASKRAAALRFA